MPRSAAYTDHLSKKLLPCNPVDAVSIDSGNHHHISGEPQQQRGNRLIAGGLGKVPLPRVGTPA